MTETTALDLKCSRDVLSRTPATLDALLRGLPDDWLRANEGPDTFSPYDAVGPWREYLPILASRPPR